MEVVGGSSPSAPTGPVSPVPGSPRASGWCSDGGPAHATRLFVSRLYAWRTSSAARRERGATSIGPPACADRRPGSVLRRFAVGGGVGLVAVPVGLGGDGVGTADGGAPAHGLLAGGTSSMTSW